MLKVMKKISYIMLSCMLILSVTGCSNEKKDSDNKQEKTITVIDQAGRTVELEESASRIVSAYYVSTYTMLSLGNSGNVVGLENKADTRNIYTLVDPTLLEKPGIGTSKAIDVEAIVALEPDVVIIPLKLQDYITSFDELGIKVIVVNPESQEQLEEMILLLGEVTGTSAKANELVAYYKQKVDMLNGIDKTNTPSVYMASNSSYLEVATTSMYQNTIIELAGGSNAMENVEGDYWTAVSYETIIVNNPEVIIVPPGASYSVEDIMQDKQLMDVDAIKNKQVYQMPKGLEEWDSPVPSGILGSLWLTSILQSDSYTHDDFVKDVQAFYQEFYGFDIDVTMLDK